LGQGAEIALGKMKALVDFRYYMGLTNAFIPTQGYFMAALGILGIPWGKWVRWLLPLLAVWLVIGCAAVVLASLIRLGPF
jgi:uncharacterized ion transporter superfamily protein YfcC